MKSLERKSNADICPLVHNCIRETMKNKIFWVSLCSIILLLTLLLSACDNNNNNNIPEESNSSPDNIKAVAFTIWDCFIAPDPEVEPEYVEYYESYDCIPGYVYFKKDVYGEVKLLLAKQLKVQDIADVVNKVYAVTEDNEVVSVNKQDCSYNTVYKLQYDSCDDIEINEKRNLLYFNDGDYIIQLNTSNDNCEIVVHSDNGVSQIVGGGSFGKVDGFYYCDICGDTGEFFIWRDNDLKTYWYHPETCESEQIDWESLFWGTPIY